MAEALFYLFYFVFIQNIGFLIAVVALLGLVMTGSGVGPLVRRRTQAMVILAAVLIISLSGNIYANWQRAQAFQKRISDQNAQYRAKLDAAAQALSFPVYNSTAATFANYRQLSTLNIVDPKHVSAFTAYYLTASNKPSFTLSQYDLTEASLDIGYLTDAHNVCAVANAVSCRPMGTTTLGSAYTLTKTDAPAGAHTYWFVDAAKTRLIVTAIDPGFPGVAFFNSLAQTSAGSLPGFGTYVPVR